ncbi:MAG: DUF3619 family protein [Burkholderiales bacterium]
MNEHQFAAKIGPVLDAGLRLEPAVLARLEAARGRALAAQCAGARAPATSVRDAASRRGTPVGAWAQVGLSIALLVLALGGVHFWQEARQAAAANARITEEIVEVDTRVLTGDLPIKAYLDEDFHEWLKQSSE